MSLSCYQTPNVPVNSTELAPCAATGGTDPVSLCCNPSEICLTNGLCATNTGLFYSGGCTDSTYKATICPKLCTTLGDTYVVGCGEGGSSAVKPGDFCCSPNGSLNCCNNATNALGLTPSVSSAVAGVSPTNAPIRSSSSKASATSTRTLTLTSASASRASTSAPTAGAAKHANDGPLILGLSLGLGIPFVMLCIFLLWRYLTGMQDQQRTRQMSESMRGAATLGKGPSDSPEHRIAELANDQSTGVTNPPCTLHSEEQSAQPVEMSTDTEVLASRGEGSLTPGSRIVPDYNPRHPQDGYLGAVTATQSTGYLPPP